MIPLIELKVSDLPDSARYLFLLLPDYNELRFCRPGQSIVQF